MHISYARRCKAVQEFIESSDSVQDVADRHCVTVNTVYRWLRDVPTRDYTNQCNTLVKPTSSN